MSAMRREDNPPATNPALAIIFTDIASAISHPCSDSKRDAEMGIRIGDQIATRKGILLKISLLLIMISLNTIFNLLLVLKPKF
jgi:hypothetical protein